MLAVLDTSDFVLLGLLMLLLGYGTAYGLLRPADRARLARIERKLDLLLTHLQVAVPDPATAAGLSEDVRRLAAAGRKMAAIRLHRRQAGVGTRTATAAVEAYLAERG